MIQTVYRGIARVGDTVQILLNEQGVIRARVWIDDETLTAVSTTVANAPFLVSNTDTINNATSAPPASALAVPQANGKTTLLVVSRFQVLQIFLRSGSGQDNIANKNIIVQTYSDSAGETIIDTLKFRVYPTSGAIIQPATLTPLKTLNLAQARTTYDAAQRRLKVIENIRREGTFTILYYYNKELVQMNLGKLRPINLPLESQLIPYNKGRGEQIEMNFALVKPQFAPETAQLIQMLSDISNIPELNEVHVPETANAGDYRGIFRPTAIPEMRVQTEDFVLVLTNLDVNNSMSIGFDSVNNNAQVNFNAFQFRSSTTAEEIVSGLYLTSELA